MKEIKAVPAEPGQDDEEWCNRGCDHHWRIQVDTASLVMLTFDSSHGQAYLSEDEADMIGNALKDCARVVRECRDRQWKTIVIHGFSLESHDPAARRPS